MGGSIYLGVPGKGLQQWNFFKVRQFDADLAKLSASTIP